jgi:beta-lactamase class A
MSQTRRAFLKSAVSTVPLGVTAISMIPSPVPKRVDADEILDLFEGLPGELAIKIVTSRASGELRVLAAINGAKRMFVGSAIKSFVLAEGLRQAEPNTVETISTRQLNLDASVWSVDSQTFNPPNLIGMVSERTAMEAMIMHSDNTGTDMCLKQVRPDNVRKFIASAGLTETLIPDSTRSFFGYLVGANDYKTFTWEELIASLGLPLVNPPLNPVETLASSADDFVSYYSRALQGEFFQKNETLTEFRRILAMGDAIWLVPLPLGVSAFVKGGSIDVPGYHALCVPGGMFFGNRWVYFCFTINWTASTETDPDTMKAFLAAVSQALRLVKEALQNR